MGVIEKAAALPQLETGRAAELAEAHRDDIRRSTLALEEIEKSIELRGSVGPGGDFDDGRA